MSALQMVSKIGVGLAVIWCLSVGPACAPTHSEFTQFSPVRWDAAADGRVSAKVDQNLVFLISADIATGWHLYALTQPSTDVPMTTIAVTADPFLILDGEIVGPPPRQIFDQGLNAEARTYEGKVAFRVPVRVAAGTPAGVYSLMLEVTWVACGDGVCFGPHRQEIAFRVQLRTWRALPPAIQ